MSEFSAVTDLLPQRPPFLFVDKVIKIEGQKIFTQKKLSGDEDFFSGHFPGMPIMPGVLLCEAIFQSGSMLVQSLPQSADSLPGSLGVVTRIENSKFKRFCRPGDLLEMEVELVEQLANTFAMKGKITVGGKLVMSTQFTCALVARNLGE